MSGDAYVARQTPVQSQTGPKALACGSDPGSGLARKGSGLGKEPSRGAVLGLIRIRGACRQFSLVFPVYNYAWCYIPRKLWRYKLQPLSSRQL
jgi:hypothetical protein